MATLAIRSTSKSAAQFPLLKVLVLLDTDITFKDLSTVAIIAAIMQAFRVEKLEQVTTSEPVVAAIIRQ